MLFRRRIPSALADVPLFAGCPPRELRELSSLGTRVSVPTGRTVLAEGSFGTEVAVVLSGTAACLVRGEEVARFGPGDLFGEVAALDGGRRTASVVARGDMELLILDAGEFDRLLATSSVVARRLLGAGARRLRRANDLVSA
ncbi:MAG: Crp/Fnr family transcriptional regulator [Acidimicrobiales bacterium]